MAPAAPGKEQFQEAYEGKVPWDIGKPQPVFVQAADQITGSILDRVCGTGENALFFAERGHKVTGIDFLEKPILEARKNPAAGTASYVPGDGRSGSGRDPGTLRLGDRLRLVPRSFR